jgi:YVTN family beta-propeller protein
MSDTFLVVPISARDPALQFGILGPLEVSRAGQPIELGSAKERVLLAILVLHAGEVVSSDGLIDALWGSQPPSDPLASFHVLISRLRKALGAECIVTRGRSYTLSVEADSIDLVRFERLLARGRESLAGGDPRQASATLRLALSMWRGEPLADLPPEHVVEIERVRLGELRQAAFEARVDSDLALGHHAALLPELERAARERPLRERAIAQLMLAQYRCGRQAESLGTYRLARSRLVETLGLEPGGELQQLEREILQHATSLATPDHERLQLRRRRRGGLALGAAIAGLLAAGALTFALTRAGHKVPALTVGPNSVAIIDPASNKLVGKVAVNAKPVGIAAGENSLWVANVEGETVSRIDARTRRRVATIGTGRRATDVAVTTHWVWIGNGSDGSLSRIDPRTNSVTKTADVAGRSAVFHHGEYGVATRGNSLWVAGGGRAVLHLDADTGAIERRIPLGTTPLAIAVGDGSVWVATADDRIVRIDPRSAVTSDVNLDWPVVVGIGADGVWVGSNPPEQRGSVWQVDPYSLNLSRQTAVPDPVAIAVSPHAVWIASGRDDRVYRINPNTNEVVAIIKLQGRPAGVALAAGVVWVTVDAPA